MVPGITDTECRIVELRFRELHAEAERQRRATQATTIVASRLGLVETMLNRVGAIMEQASRRLKGVHAWEPTEHSPTPDTLAVGK